MDNQLDVPTNYINPEFMQTLVSKKKTLAELENNIRELKQKQTEYAQELKSLQRQFFFSTGSLANYEFKFSIGDKKIEVLKEKKTQLDSKIEELRKKLETKEEHLRSHRDLFSTNIFRMCEETFKGNRNDHHALKRDLEQEIKQYSLELEQLDKEIVQLTQDIEGKHQSEGQEMEPSEMDQLKSKTEALSKELSKQNKKLHLSHKMKEYLTQAPVKDPEFLRLKAELEAAKCNMGKGRTSNAPQHPEEIKVQNPLKNVRKKRMRVMPNQKRLDDFWNITK